MLWGLVLESEESLTYERFLIAHVKSPLIKLTEHLQNIKSLINLPEKTKKNLDSWTFLDYSDFSDISDF